MDQQAFRESLHSPISKLSPDVLWSIFSWNADMFAPLEYDIDSGKQLTRQSALQVTLVTSHVCHDWRSLLLALPAIWGSVLRLDLLNEDGRNEITKRTGTAPLCLTGSLSGSDMRIGIFSRFLQANWPRIKKLHLRIKGYSTAHKSIWDVFLLSAPSLEWFSIAFEHKPPKEKSHPIFSRFGERPELFANRAPRLQFLHLHGITIHRMRTFGLSQLHTLKLESTGISALEALDAIKQMHSLEFLRLHNLSGELSPDLMEAKSIELRHLTYLGLYNSFRTDLTLARSIKAAEACSLSFQPSLISTGGILKQDIPLVCEMIDRYIKTHLSCGKDLSVEIDSRFALRRHNLDHQDKTSWLYSRNQQYLDLCCPHFIFTPFGLPGAEGTALPLLKSFLKMDFQSVKKLSLNIALRLHPSILSKIIPMLDAFEAVESLTATDMDLDRVINQEIGRNKPLFPNLRRLRLWDLFQDSDKLATDFQKFYARRKAHHLPPLEALDLGHNPGADWTFLDDEVGLKVTWAWGTYEESVPGGGYICGSGNPGELYFPDKCRLYMR
ncbi:hypothetical protein CVT26_014226 [Gymnopilus dilepis]|uniref:F-box domain-containing protein n=1 Tax=Gymnopilus dilepis TaxID=231916 RepID=A0A409VXD9_9AGAR|nr:hypothetical protein CVT26_014226 [Gymnopilus dilepis]